MQLIHYSNKKLTQIHSTEQSFERLCVGKPCGLWVSVKGPMDWREWCKGEGYRLNHLRVANKITLTKDAKILHLSTPEQLDKLTQDYAFRPYDNIDSFTMVDWVKISKEYQGVIIAPYIYERRFTHMWYYGWDCASGCIWDAKAVAANL